MNEATPRITAPYLAQFTERNVRLVGKVVQLRGETAVVDAGGQITVSLNRDAHLSMGHAAEIVGKVQKDLTVRVLMSTDFGTDFDFNAMEAVVDATHRYREIFYGDD